jgi:hypothetical protein
VSAVTVLQFYLVMLRDGESDLQRHMIFTDFGTCLLGPLAIAALIGLDLATQTTPEPASLPRQPDPAAEESAVVTERQSR